MSRAVTHRYLDPLDAVWMSAAERIGLRVVRSPDVFASTDGRGTLVVGTDETLDPDDCLAQMVLHELCHSLVEGPESLRREDWGLDNQTGDDLSREHACLRLQAALTAPLGLRRVLAPTTEHRAFYDALGAEPLAPREDPTSALARIALRRSHRPPWAPHIGRALEATARIVAAAAEAGVASDHLVALVEPAAAAHPIAGDGRGDGPRFVAPGGSASCADCAWRYRGGRGKPVDRCRQADGARIDPDWPACERFERDEDVDCQSCGACCREAYGAVVLSSRDPVVRAHPDMVVRDGRTLLLRREGDRCAALRGDLPERYACTIYGERPRTCRDFERRGEHCVTARRRVGLS